MTGLSDKRRSQRRWMATAALVGWTAGVHALPLAHAVIHDLPHEHIAGAVVYIANAFEHQKHLQAHRQGLDHGHAAQSISERSKRTRTSSAESRHPRPGSERARPRPAQAPQSDHQDRPDQGGPFGHGLDSLAHGFAAVLTPGSPPAPAERLSHPVHGIDRSYFEWNFSPAVAPRARGPPAPTAT